MNVSNYFAAIMGYGEKFPQQMFRKWLEMNYPFIPATDKKLAEGFNPGPISTIGPSSVVMLVIVFFVLVIVVVACVTDHEEVIKNNSVFSCLILAAIFSGTLRQWLVNYSFSVKLNEFCEERKKFAELVLLPSETEEDFQIAFERTQESIAREKMLLQSCVPSEQSFNNEARCHNKMKELDIAAGRFGLNLHEWGVYFTKVRQIMDKSAEDEEAIRLGLS